MAQRADGGLVSMEGEIVEIFERDGRRFARIVLTPHVVCEVAAEDFGDAHLGDRVVVNGQVSIEQVAVVPPRDIA